MLRILLLFLGGWVLAGCAGRAAPAERVRILALGDSYTIGEGVAVEERWPVQLADALQAEGQTVDEPQIIAQTGWTTSELAAAIAREDPQGPYDLVTLLIGVNNQYRGRPLAEYAEEFAVLLAQAVGFAGGDPGRVIVLSIPDWGVTPYARRIGRTEAVDEEINAFNAANQRISAEAGVRYVDVTPSSRLAAADQSLLAEDGLHPSAKMYAAWVALVLPEALDGLASTR